MMDKTVTDYQINKTLVRTEVDWEDLGHSDVKGGAFWGDGHNWYCYNAITDPAESFRLIKKYNLKIERVAASKDWVATNVEQNHHTYNENLQRAIAEMVYHIVTAE